MYCRLETEEVNLQMIGVTSPELDTWLTVIRGEAQYTVLGWWSNEKRQQLGRQEHIRYFYARVGNGVEGLNREREG
jgi:hypothetical protein